VSGGTTGGHATWILASAVLALTACSTPEPQTATAGPVPLKVALNWFPEPEFGGYYQALLDGTYKAAGLDVTLIPGGPGVPVLEMLASGQADVAISGADDLLIKRARGLDAVAIFAGFQDSPVGLMVHAGSGFTTLGQIQGGNVAIEAGSPFQQYLWASQGWEGKVAMVPTTGSLGAFAADPSLIQQAYVTSEPCVAEGQGLHVNFIPGREAGWNPYASLAVVRGTDATAGWVAKFRQASKDGWTHYVRDPAVANAEINRLNPDVPLDRMGCITARQAPYVVGTDGLGAMTSARWKETADALTRAGLPATPDGAWLKP
jgi:NitT/TauT family transport system substrate-binding protein